MSAVIASRDTLSRLRFKPMKLADLSTALAFRKDSYICSFGTVSGFWEEVGPEGSLYREKVKARMLKSEWTYLHVWSGVDIVGQLEFRDFSQVAGYGYVHLFYLVPGFRDLGLFKQLESVVIQALKNRGCRGAILSVSNFNQRAIMVYRHHGWRKLAANPKRGDTDFYSLEFASR